MVDEVRGAERSSRRTRMLVGLLLAVLVLGLGGDRWQAARERSALLDAVAQGEQVAHRSGASLRGLATYVGPLTANLEAPQAAREWAFDTLSVEAGRWRPRVQDRRAQVLAVPVAPWHFELRTAREAYAARLGAWSEVLAARERRVRARSDPGQAVRSSVEQARDALLAADADPDRVRALLGGGEAAARRRR